jgi:hypothetical protein
VFGTALQQLHATWTGLTDCSLHPVYQHKEEFPLYTETVRFCQHDEMLVRTHVRTIALNVFQSMMPPRISRGL